jgi:DNA-binding NarL/FixJ family response regulator
MPGAKPLKILVVITPTATQQQVAELKDAGCLGIGLDMNYYTVEQAMPGARALINGTPYWPKEFISQLPNEPEKLLHVMFRDSINSYFTPETKKTFETQLGMKVAYCGDWYELNKAIALNPHQLALHIDTLKRMDLTIPEIIAMIQTRLKIAGLDIPIAVAIMPDTDVKTIKELKRAGVFGIIPGYGYWGIDASMEAVHALTNRVPHWPKHIINQLPGNKPVVKNTTGTIRLTARQGQVLDLVKNRGASNKVIARMLNISESTVKLHLTAILKKYGARNRTQLALFANQ